MMFSAEGAKFEVLPLPVVEKSQKKTFPLCAANGVPLGIGYRRTRSKTRIPGLPDGHKKF